MQTKRSWIQTAARWLTLAVVFCLIVPNFGPGATRVAHAQPAAPPIMSEAQIGPDSMFWDYSTTPPTLPAELTPATVHAADVATQVGDTYTWTQDARADWEQGTLENLDSAAVSGTLQLAQRYFSTNETILPKAELAAVQQNPTIAVDVQGNAYAVWQDQRADDYDIYFAYRPTGGVWEDNEKVNDDAGIAGQSAPAIAVDGQGNAYAIWTDGRNGNSDIYFAYRPAGGVWGVNVKVNDDVGIATQGTPGIAVDTQGNAYAIWTDARNGNNDIYFAYHPAEGMWGANLKINDDTGSANQSGRAIDVDDSGNAYALWTDQRNGNLDVYFATRPSSGEWEPNAKVNDGMGATGLTSSAPDIAVDGQGNAYAIWLGVGAGDDIYASYRPVDGTWSASVKINDDTFSQQAWPAITVDENGNAYAVWWDHRNGMDVYFATHPVGGTWGDNIEIGDISSYAWWGFCDVATDGNNNAYIVWADNRNDNPDIYFATCTETGVCEANAKINDDPGIAGQNNPVIAVDSSDNIYALWEDERNGNADIYFSYRFEDGAWNASVKVNDDSGTMGQSGPALAVDAASNLYAVWRDWRETQTYIIDDVRSCWFLGETWYLFLQTQWEE